MILNNLKNKTVTDFLGVFFFTLFLFFYYTLPSLDYEYVPYSIFAFPHRILVILSAVLMSFLAATVLGHFWTKKIFKLQLENTIENLVVNIFIGFSIQSILYVFIGSIGFLNKPIVLLLFFLPTLFLSGKLFDLLFQPIKQVVSRLSEFSLVGFFFVFTIVFIGLKTFFPVVEWDAVVYHVPALLRFLTDSKIATYFHEDPYNFPFSSEIIGIPFVALNLYECTQLQVYIIFIVSIVFLRFFCKQIGDNKLFYLTLLLLLATPALWSSAARIQAETTIAAFILSIFYLIYQSKNIRNITLIAAMSPISGMVAGSKITGAVFVAVIIISFILILIKEKISLQKISVLKFSLMFFVLVYPSLFWYGKNLLVFNNPTYPKFPYIMSLSQTDPILIPMRSAEKILYRNKKNRDAEIATWDSSDELKNMNNKVYKTKDSISYDYGLWDLIKSQEIFARSWSDGYYPFLLLFFVPGWVFFPKVRWMGGICGLFLIILLRNSHLIRYAIPVFPPICFFTAVNIHFYLNLLGKQMRRCLLSIIIISSILNSLNLIAEIYKSLQYSDIKQMFLGEASIGDAIKNIASPTGTVYEIEKIMETYPNDYGVIRVGDGKTLYTKRKFIAEYDNIAKQAIPWIRLISKFDGNHQSIIKHLKKENFRYIYLDLSYFKRILKLYDNLHKNDIWVRNIDISDPELLRYTLSDLLVFLKKYGKLNYLNQKRDIYLFELP